MPTADLLLVSLSCFDMLLLDFVRTHDLGPKNGYSAVHDIFHESLCM